MTFFTLLLLYWEYCQINSSWILFFSFFLFFMMIGKRLIFRKLKSLNVYFFLLFSWMFIFFCTFFMDFFYFEWTKSLSIIFFSFLTRSGQPLQIIMKDCDLVHALQDTRYQYHSLDTEWEELRIIGMFFYKILIIHKWIDFKHCVRPC